MSSLAEQYKQLTRRAAFAEMGPRTQIELTGDDRQAFLNNFCTADVKALQPGAGAEAFICNVKGKVLGHVFIYCGERSLVMETTPGQADVLMGHLDRYIITEDVQLADVSDGWAFLYIGGEEATSRLETLTGAKMPERHLEFITAKASDVSVAIGRGGAISHEGYTLCIREGDWPAVQKILQDAGFALCQHEALEAVRIEAGMPLYGRDITDDNLPQEVHRDAAAINLDKGCYLGQETVARIDALGHVNRLLVGAKFDEETLPADGTELRFDDKSIGRVTSAAFSPRLNAPLALAYVRSAHAQAGAKLKSDRGEAEIVELPLMQ